MKIRKIFPGGNLRPFLWSKTQPYLMALVLLSAMVGTSCWHETAPFPTAPAYHPTVTFTPTISRTPTLTATSTHTGTPTLSPTITDTPTITLTPTITDTPTITMTPTITFTPTITSTPTVTPTKTATPMCTAYPPTPGVNHLPNCVWYLFVKYNCFDCHSAGNTPPFLDTKEAAYANMVNVSALECVPNKYVQPNSPSTSVLYSKLTSSPCAASQMPQGGPFLSAGELQTLYDWINNGALSGP